MIHHTFLTAVVDPSGIANPCDVRLAWDSAEPAAMNWELTPEGHETVEWTSSREALIEALTTSDPRSIGDGDVRFVCEGVRLYLYLDSPQGDAVLCMPRETVDLMVEDTIRSIPSGSDLESAVITESIDSLLAGVLSAD